jgi:prepilin-type N-terminal cleavage/methylation domain-containing protein
MSAKPYKRNTRSKHKKGMTLVEVIVSFAILAIVSIIMVSAFLTSSNVKMKGDAFTRGGESIDKAIASGAAGVPQPEQNITGLELNSDGVDTVIPGQVYEYTDPKTGKVFRVIGDPGK